MPRRPRHLDATGTYHVTCRGNDRRDIFHDDNDRATYLALLLDTVPVANIAIYHYVLMDNHVHLVLYDADAGLSRAMKRVNHRYTYYIKRKYGFVGQLWQGRFHAELIEDDGYLLTCGIYVELNPVRAGMVRGPGDHPWSSYGYYGEGLYDPLLTPSPAYLALTDDERQRRRIYRLLCRQWLEKK